MRDRLKTAIPALNFRIRPTLNVYYPKILGKEVAIRYEASHAFSPQIRVSLDSVPPLHLSP
jgi:hypothetical protein